MCEYNLKNTIIFSKYKLGPKKINAISLGKKVHSYSYLSRNSFSHVWCFWESNIPFDIAISVLLIYSTGMPVSENKDFVQV